MSDSTTPPAVLTTGPVTLTLAQFRQLFGGAFANTTLYPDIAVAFYLNLTQTFNARRFGQYLNYAAACWTAHYLTLDYQAQRDASIGNPSGLRGGVVSSKSVGGASTSFDLGDAGVKDGEDYNLTIYGRRYAKIARMAGAGGTQVGIGITPPGFGVPWQGPLMGLLP